MSLYVYKRIVVILICCAIGFVTGIMAVPGNGIAVSGESEADYDRLISCFSGAGTRTLLTQAAKYMDAGKKQEAMVLYLLEMNRRTEGLDSAQFADHVLAYINAADIYYADGNYPAALGLYVKVLKLSESSPYQPFLQRIYKTIGNVYAMSQDYPKSIAIYKQALNVRQTDMTQRYKTLQNLIGAYIYSDSIAQARKYYDMALKTPHESTDESRFMEGFTMALILSGEGKRAEAVKRFEGLATEAARLGLDPRYESSCYEEISKCHMADGDYYRAVEYMERCKVNAERHNQLHMFVECLKTLSSLYDRLGQTSRSLQLKSRYLEIKDSIFNVREFDNVKNQQFVYEMDKVNDMIAGLNREMERRNEVIGWQRTVIAVIVGALLLILISLFLVYLQKRRLNESYQSLFRMNKESADERNRAEETNTRLRRQIKELRQTVERMGESAAPENKTKETVVPKYSSSNLNKETRDALAEAISDIMEHTEEYCDPDFSLDTLANRVGSNAKYVSQVINEVYGKNFNNYVNAYRIRLAAMRLADTRRYGHLTVRAVGDSVGYRSPTTFINVFRKINGMTPSIFQKMAQQEAAAPDD